MITVAAQLLGVQPRTIYNYRDRHPRVQEALQEERHKFVDTAELALYNAVVRGEAWAVSLVVKTLGRDRGYVEQFHVDQNQLQLIPMALEALTGFAPLPDAVIDISPEEIGGDDRQTQELEVPAVEEVKPPPMNGNGNGHRTNGHHHVEPARQVNDDDEDKGNGDDWAL